MAFYHSLGRVLGVDSTDVLRVLGSYPTEGPQRPSNTASDSSSTPSKPPRITTLFATAPLPLGPHASDTYQLSALLTPSKLVVVGLKPSPRTWYRKLRSLGAGLSEGGEEGGLVGGAVWRTGASSEKGGVIGVGSGEGRDPLLAFWWGNVVRFVGVRVVEVEAGGAGNVDEVGGGGGKKGGAAGESVKRVEFLEAGRWEAEGVVRGLEWLNEPVSYCVASRFVSAPFLFAAFLRRIGLDEKLTSPSSPLLFISPYLSIFSSSPPRLSRFSTLGRWIASNAQTSTVGC